MAADVAAFVNVVTAALLVGNEVGTWAVVHPALHRLPFEQERAAEQQITRRYGYFMPFLMVATIVAGVVAGGLSSGEQRTLLFAGSGCFTAMLAITLTGNVPLNLRTLRFPAGGDPDEWRELRGRWDRLHLGRVALDVGGLACIALAVV